MLMICVNNNGYENCMTVGKIYDVEIEYLNDAGSMKKFIDDNGEPLQTMLDLFEVASSL